MSGCIVVNSKGVALELCTEPRGHFPKGGALMQGDTATVFPDEGAAQEAISVTLAWAALETERENIRPFDWAWEGNFRVMPLVEAAGGTRNQ